MLKPMKMIETNTLDELKEELNRLQKEKETCFPHDYESKREYDYIIAGIQFRIDRFEDHR